MGIADIENFIKIHQIDIYAFEHKVSALLLMVVISAFAGSIGGWLSGFHFPNIKPFNGYVMEPKIKGIVLPPLMFMILSGCFSRNFFQTTMQAYPSDWTYQLRNFCLSLLLIRGGLNIAFKGQQVLIVIVSAIPQFFEATMYAILAHYFFGMPFNTGYTFGYVMSCCSPSIVVPGMVSLIERGYGKSLGITPALIACGSFDDIFCILNFGVWKTIAYNKNDLSDASLIHDVGHIILQNAVGFVVGLALGFASKTFNYIEDPKTRILSKFFYIAFGALFFAAVGEATGFHEAKYLSCLTFGYVCYRFWEQDKPQREIYWLWFFVQPVFFGSVGATLVFSTIESKDLYLGLVCIFIGVIARMVFIFIVSYVRQDFTTSERVFMSMSLIPKGTVQAALGGVVLKDALKLKNVEFIEYGHVILTTAVISIILLAPTGSILINSFGPKLLRKDQQYTEHLPITQDINAKDSSMELEVRTLKDSQQQQLLSSREYQQ